MAVVTMSAFLGFRSGLCGSSAKSLSAFVLVDLFPYPRVVVPVRDIVFVLSPFHYFAEYPKETIDTPKTLNNPRGTVY